ncbi:MAG: hypothetical protein AABZ55_07605 [Bdellovibrionota bacterium]
MNKLLMAFLVILTGSNSYAESVPIFNTIKAVMSRVDSSVVSVSRSGVPAVSISGFGQELNGQPLKIEISYLQSADANTNCAAKAAKAARLSALGYGLVVEGEGMLKSIRSIYTNWIGNTDDSDTFYFTKITRCAILTSGVPMPL